VTQFPGNASKAQFPTNVCVSPSPGIELEKSIVRRERASSYLEDRLVKRGCGGGDGGGGGGAGGASELLPRHRGVPVPWRFFCRVIAGR
jgi:hypothetical protein